MPVRNISQLTKVDKVDIRMYCMGTGDCFVLKFFDDKKSFHMMIDCGSCSGTKEDFEPYITNLAEHVDNRVDLLIVTHEHNDHVNGFAKCASVFEDGAFLIKEAWFAWTENPDDPSGRAQKLRQKKEKMKKALGLAIKAMEEHVRQFEAVSEDADVYNLVQNKRTFLDGLRGLSAVNLAETGTIGKALPGMINIKKILSQKKTKVRYLDPGTTILVPQLPGLKFHILGPPLDGQYIFKDGKEGSDVYKRKVSFFDEALADLALLEIGSRSLEKNDFPFSANYILGGSNTISGKRYFSYAERRSMLYTKSLYQSTASDWRKIDTEWLNSAGTLALRLNSHINNTSLAIAIESEISGKVILLPGDAEYGSWESWHCIPEWEKKGKDNKHLVEDLLNRTVFYKVSHHLSYNGTPLEKGIKMMMHPDLVAMATLDRSRIAVKWKSTMPNSSLLQELNKRCQGKVFIMDEFEIQDKPSGVRNPSGIYKEQKHELASGKTSFLFKEYSVHFSNS